MLETLQSNLHLDLPIKGNEQGSFFLIKDLQKLRARLKNLSEVPPVRKLATRLMLNPLINSPQPELQLIGNGYTELSTLMGELNRYGGNLIEVLQAVVEDQPATGLSIQLARATDLHGLRAVLDDLQLVFDHMLLREQGAVAELVGFDVGSQWLEMGLKSARAVLIAGFFFGSAIKVIQAKQSYEIWAQQTKEMQSRTKVLQADERVATSLADWIVTSVKENLEATKQEQIASFDRKFYPDGPALTPEQTLQLTEALTRLTELVERGTEFRPALSAPEEVKAAFPDPSEKMLPAKPTEKALATAAAGGK
jgi:hypothetical protein